MQEYVIELSKYFIAFFMVLYTASCFYTFRYPVGEKHRGVFILQDLLMFLVQVLCFLNLSLVSGDFQYLFFFAFILIFLFATITMVWMRRLLSVVPINVQTYITMEYVLKFFGVKMN
mgnify:CR=1 FL=1